MILIDKFTHITTLFLTTIVLSGCGSIPTHSPPALVGVETERLTDSEDPEEMIEIAARYSTYSTPLPRQLAAFQLAQRAYRIDPSNREAALTLARSALLLSGLIKDNERKYEVIRKGYEAAGQAGGGGNDPQAAYFFGAHLGLLIEEKGLTAAGEVARFEKAMRIASEKPDTDLGGPLRALGMLYLRAPAWPAGVGDLELSLEMLERSAREYPGHPENHLFLAYALEEDDQTNEARKELRRAEESISNGQWGDFEDRWRQEIKQFREELDN